MGSLVRPRGDPEFPSAGMNFEGHAAPAILPPTCMVLLTMPGPIKEGKVF